MTFDEFIKNPMGKGTAVMTSRSMYQDKYTKQWDELKVRENGLIPYHLYVGNDDYYLHFKIPSEELKGFHYDTIIRFYLEASDKKFAMENNLHNYSVQFYSNDPSFVYTFAYAFKSHQMLIKDLYGKMSTLALRQPAKIKNPKNELGYVKSIYFAYIEAKTLGLFNKVKWEVKATKYNKSVWNGTVDHADDKIRLLQEGVRAARKETKLKNQNEGKEEIAKEEQINKAKAPITNKFKSPNPKGVGHFNHGAKAEFKKLILDQKKAFKPPKFKKP